MNKIYWLDRIQSSQKYLVGEQAYALSQLHQQGYPVFPTFSIGKDLFQEFIDYLDNSAELFTNFADFLSNIDVEDHRSLQAAVKTIRQAISHYHLSEEWRTNICNAAENFQSTSLSLSPFLILPEAIASKHNSLFLAQTCYCLPNNISIAIQNIWIELFNAPGLFFFQKTQLDWQQLNLSILVQPIGNAIASGILEIDDRFINLQLTWGLENSLILGEVKPDLYRINRSTGKIEMKELGSKHRAYRLKTCSDLENASDRCLEAYLLSEEQQQEYVLDEDRLKQLIQLAEKLASQQQYRGCLHWTLLDFPSQNLEPQFYFTQSYPHLIYNQVEADYLHKNPEIVLKGVAASPGIAIAPLEVLAHSNPNLQEISSGKILVTRKIAPDWLPILKKAVGIITEQGGMTSHAAILAREIGIPAITEFKNATKLLKTGQSALLNGDKGLIYLLPVAIASQEKPIITQTSSASQLRISKMKDIEKSSDRNLFKTEEAIATKLMLNLSQPSLIVKATELPVDGIGLIRSELMLLDLLASQPLPNWLNDAQKPQFIEHLSNLISQFAASFFPRPVFYRTYDRRSWEFLNTDKQTHNLVNSSTLFELELQAIARVQAYGYNNIKLILPFVRSLEEFKFCRRCVEEKGLTNETSFQLWIMAEVPSVLFLLSEYVQAGVQGIAIGTNDLTQLLLGVDREASHQNKELNAIHPAMLKAIQQLIEGATSLGIPASICGQAPIQYPEIIDRLVEWGISSISVDTEAVISTYHAIARAEKRLLLQAARSIQT